MITPVVFLQTEILYLYALHTYKSNSIVKIWQSIYRKFYLKLPGGNGIAFFHGVLIKYRPVYFSDKYLYLLFIQVGATLQEVVEAIVTLEMTAADIKSNWPNFFNVIVSSQPYTFSGSTLNLNGAIDCEAGKVATEGICGETAFCI